MLFQKKNSSPKLQVEGNEVYLPLAELDCSMAMQTEPGITTINFFPAQDVDYDKSLLTMKERFKRICDVNPWLVGKIIKDKKRHARLLCHYPKTPLDEDIDDTFVIEASTELQGITSSSSYSDIVKALASSGAIVRTGSELVNKEDRVSKLTFVSIGNNTEYALVFSMSHSVGDGHTYYKLMSMFSDETKIEGLIGERLEGFESSIDKMVGVPEHKFIHSPWFMANIVGSMIRGTSMKVSANYVDLDKVAATKTAAKESHQDDPNFFISTNDIITSTYAKDAGTDALLMACNARGRVEEATDIHAGNYESLLYYDRESYDSPEAIRQSLRNGPPYRRASDKPMPKWNKTLFTTISWITTWAFASFNAELHLWNSQGLPSPPVALHLPIYDPTEMPSQPLCIIFKPKKDKLASMYFYEEEKNNYYEKTVARGDLLGPSVNEKMFE